VLPRVTCAGWVGPVVGKSGKATGTGMSAVQDALRQRRREARGLQQPWPARFQLFGEPLPLIGYVAVVLVCYLAFVGCQAVVTPLTGGDVTLFVALMGCGACCVEATRRLGQPTGVWRDMLSAW
jgi:hypothetical protein